MPPPPFDPRIPLLVPWFRRRSASFAKRYSFTLETDDAQQIALLALHTTALRYPTVDASSLLALAWTRARGAIVDFVRSQNGGRRAGQRFGYGFLPHEVAAARATGELPSLALNLDDTTDLVTALEPVCSRPRPDEALESSRAFLRARALLGRHLRTLNRRDRTVIFLVLLGVSQADVASLFGVSAPRVNQLLHAFTLRFRFTPASS